MAIFPSVETEKTVQVNDKTRINASKSFVSKDNAAITLVRIRASATDPWVTVSGSGLTSKDWFLDWEYQAAGSVEPEVEITAGTVETKTGAIEVISSEDDKLLSSDSDLTSYEPDILKWVTPGRNSFLNIHRAAQALILDWLDSIRLWRKDGSKLTKDDLAVTDDLNQLSTYYALMLIFRGLSNKVDDVFYQKARDYEGKALSVKNRGRIQADFDGSGQLDPNEVDDNKSYFMVRR